MASADGAIDQPVGMGNPGGTGEVIGTGDPGIGMVESGLNPPTAGGPFVIGALGRDSNGDEHGSGARAQATVGAVGGIFGAPRVEVSDTARRLASEVLGVGPATPRGYFIGNVGGMSD